MQLTNVHIIDGYDVPEYPLILDPAKSNEVTWTKFKPPGVLLQIVPKNVLRITIADSANTSYSTFPVYADKPDKLMEGQVLSKVDIDHLRTYRKEIRIGNLTKMEPFQTYLNRKIAESNPAAKARSAATSASKSAAAGSAGTAKPDSKSDAARARSVATSASKPTPKTSEPAQPALKPTPKTSEPAQPASEPVAKPSGPAKTASKPVAKPSGPVTPKPDVKMVGLIFDRKSHTDMVEWVDHPNVLLIYNENVEQFRNKSCEAGGGNAKLRPYRIDRNESDTTCKQRKVALGYPTMFFEKSAKDFDEKTITEFQDAYKAAIQQIEDQVNQGKYEYIVWSNKDIPEVKLGIEIADGRVPPAQVDQMHADFQQMIFRIQKLVGARNITLFDPSQKIRGTPTDTNIQIVTDSNFFQKTKTKPKP